jgi:hypothetical protein
MAQDLNGIADAAMRQRGGKGVQFQQNGHATLPSRSQQKLPWPQTGAWLLSEPYQGAPKLGIFRATTSKQRGFLREWFRSCFKNRAFVVNKAFQRSAKCKGLVSIKFFAFAPLCDSRADKLGSSP